MKRVQAAHTPLGAAHHPAAGAGGSTWEGSLGGKAMAIGPAEERQGPKAAMWLNSRPAGGTGGRQPGRPMNAFFV